MTVFSIGCDPEVFVINRKDQKFISAVGLVPGDKANPHPVRNGAVQVDGLALEFNTEPVTSFADFDRNVYAVLDQLEGFVYKADKNLQISEKTWVDFDPEYYESLHEDSKVLGCDPDFNAYTGIANPVPDQTVPNRRGAAGHIHIGWCEGINPEHPEHFQVCRDFVKVLDMWVGIGMVLLEPDNVRKSVYGKAGAFRPKSYGVEYRVPSNAWIWDGTKRKFMWHLIQRAIGEMSEAKGWKMRNELYGYTEPDTRDGYVQEIINNNNKALAKQHLSTSPVAEYARAMGVSCNA